MPTNEFRELEEKVNDLDKDFAVLTERIKLPIMMIYGLATLLLMSIIGAIINLVINK